MNLFKRILLTWRTLKAIITLRFLDEALPKMDQLEAFWPKFEALQGILSELKDMEGRMPDAADIHILSAKLAAVDNVVAKIEAMKPPEVVLITQEGKHGKSVVDRKGIEERAEWNRMKMLAQFVHLAPRAREIEQEWQRIQQDENDAFFSFQVLKGHGETEYIYKKGIADGVRWCLTRFS